MAFDLFSLLNNITGDVFGNSDTDDMSGGIDIDGDGIIDGFDMDGDGVVDGFDMEGDGSPDTFDTDGDGLPDTYDLNGDGVIDAVDMNEDGIPEEIDIDGDGVLDFISQSQGQGDFNDGFAGSELGSQLIGNPAYDTMNFHVQNGMDTCAIVAQKSILESLTGVDIPEEELVKMAHGNGWYGPGGTQPDSVGKILEAYGYPVERSYDNSVADIMEAVESGEKVIVGLDANEIWNSARDANGQPMELQDGGHAVWVTGFYEDDAGNWSVVLNDSGTPDGAGEIVPLEDFMNAWNDFGNFAAVTDIY